MISNILVLMIIFPFPNECILDIGLVCYWEIFRRIDIISNEWLFCLGHFRPFGT
jgi:hypothetical protein